MVDRLAALGSVSPVYIASTVSCLLSLTVYIYYKRCHSYWRSRNVPGPPPKIFVGNSFEMMVTPFFSYDKLLFAQYGDVVGVYDRTEPILIVNDADIVHDVCIKQFQHFTDRRDLNADEIFSNMLLANNGDRWKRLRKLMTPAFSSSKIRSMSQFMLEPVQRMMKRMDDCDEIDLRKYIYNSTLQVIARSGLGVDLTDGPECETALEHALSVAKIPKWKVFIALLSPPWLNKLFDFTIFDRDALRYFYKMSAHVLQSRKANPHEIRDFPDFIDRLKEVGDSDPQFFSTHQLISNSVLIIAGGFETTASSLLNCLFLLAHNQAIQDKLRESLQDFHLKNAQDIDENTDASNKKLAYLEAVIREAMRLYAPVIRTERIATQRVTLSTGLTIEKGTTVTIAIHCLHRNPKYWEEPDEFRPERFMPENKHKLNQYAYMPFHAGPRNCIGKRFAWNELRLTVIEIIQKYRLLPSPKTSFPLDYSNTIYSLDCNPSKVFVRVERV